MTDLAPGDSGDTRVRVSGKFFRAGGEKFYVRGLTYGPFSPGEQGYGLKDGAVLKSDLADMVSVGANTVRLYESPPEGFLDECAQHGIRVMIGVAWPDHVDFVNQEGLWDSCVDKLRSAVATHRGHPAVLAYLVGNEISATLVRWLDRLQSAPPARP